jgi:hypothetical protein
MKAIKQSINNSYFSSKENTVFSCPDKAYFLVNEHKTIQQPASLRWASNFIHKTIRVLYHLLHGSIVKQVAIDRSGQQVLVDILSTEGSYIPRYSFLGTPQVLYMLPVNADKKSSAPLPFTVSVKTLEENCYELQIEGNKASKQELGVNIYDESNRLVFSEQITYSGSFNRLYDLKWPHCTDVSFEIISKYGICSAEII